MLLALSGGQKLGLLAAAGVFIAFALASSFLLPRRNPDYPGRALGLFIAVSIALFLAMMTSMAVLARESEEGEAQPGEAAGETTRTGTAGEGESAQGDATAGESVFASAGCGGCHRLQAANATGAVGPSLDEAKPPLELVVERVTKGKGAMPAFEDRLSEQQIRDVAAYVVESTS